MSGKHPKSFSLVSIPFGIVMFVIIVFPTVSFLTITTLGFILHFEETTGTHCNVPNVVPSVSSVAGGVTPERYIWRLGMAFVTFPRLFDSIVYYKFFSLNIRSIFFKCLNLLLVVFHWVQGLSLFGLTYISSTDNYTIHRNCFIGYASGCMLHTLLFLFLFKQLRQPPTHRDKISFRLRAVIGALHIFVFVASMYFFWRHNTFCEPYMYSIYGLLEYLVVLTNIGFNAGMFVDFQNSYLTVSVPTEVKID